MAVGELACTNTALRRVTRLLGNLYDDAVARSRSNGGSAVAGSDPDSAEALHLRAGAQSP